MNNPTIENMHCAIKIVQTFQTYMPELEMIFVGTVADTDEGCDHNITIMFNNCSNYFTYDFDSKKYVWDKVSTSKGEVVELKEEIINILNML